MSFDFSSACANEPERKWLHLARVLIPLGAASALLPAMPPWAALLLGTALALSVGNPCARLTNRLSKWLLQAAVVGLGAGVNLAVVARVGTRGIGYTLVGLAGTFALGLWLARRLRVGPKVGALICAGTAICGGSAIAAAAPAIEADAEETSASLATVFLLNGLALLLFPVLGRWAGLDAHQFGLWCALSIHDTSSVTGAAMTRGTEALATATTVKLARALWIVPVALALGVWNRRATGSRQQNRVAVPWFIAGFVAVSAVFTLLPGWSGLAHHVVGVSKILLTLTLFFIGAGLSRAAIRQVGARPFVHGSLLWLLVGGATLAAIALHWIA